MAGGGQGSPEPFEKAPMNAAVSSQLYLCLLVLLSKVKEHINTMFSKRSIAVLAVVFLSLAMSQIGSAQGGKFEVAGFGGGTHLLQEGVGTTKGVVGGRFGAAAGKRVLV